MNQEIRNKLRNVVTQCRKLLEDSVSQELEGKYGIFARRQQVTADPNASMTHLTEEEQSARKDILDHFGHIQARGFKPKEALDQLVREIAFTHLNRLCAYKMMEAREVYVGGQKFREAVSRGINSNGVKFYLADHPEEERLFNTGHQNVAYRHFLDWLGGLLSDEIGVLFNPDDPANKLYPRQKTLDEVLELLNYGGIKPEETGLREEWPKIWSQDETIGWVYQYFTPKEMREAAKDPARGGSDVPRNSNELAFRNQFFTPRYVVEFLTDNTLSRIWYEMRKGETRLAESCRYLIGQGHTVFLEPGQERPKPFLCDEWLEAMETKEMWICPPEDAKNLDSIWHYALTVDGYEFTKEHFGRECGDIANERLQKYKETKKWDGSFQELRCCLFFEQRRWRHFGYDPEGEDLEGILLLFNALCDRWNLEANFIEHRTKKDPRELRVLDPACGSGHFLLYCFDLLQTIYEEAYSDPDLGPTLKKEYATLEELVRDTPRLILANNLYGIDIDLRASQIAALALWLRCQRAYQDMGLRRDRPRINRSNFVCAEPMPGEEFMLKEFVGQLEPKLLGQLVEAVFEKMKMAGETGILLRIEDEIREVIANARKQWITETERAVDRKGHLLLFSQGEMARIRSESQQSLEFDLSGITNAEFFEQAEARVVEELRNYAEQVQGTAQLQRRLFSEDAIRGFAFVDICHRRFDVILMNPPFGEATPALKVLCNRNWPSWNSNILCAFFLHMLDKLESSGLVGAIFDRTVSVKTTYEDFRKSSLCAEGRLLAYVDLGWEVLDANVETAMGVLSKRFVFGSYCADVRNVPSQIKNQQLLDVLTLQAEPSFKLVSSGTFAALPNAVVGYDFPTYLLKGFSECQSLETAGYKAYSAHTLKAEKHNRVWWEVSIDPPPFFYQRMFNGSSYSPYSTAFREVAIADCAPYDLPRNSTTILRNREVHGKPGVCFSKRGDIFCCHAAPAGLLFTQEGRPLPVRKEADSLLLLALLNTPLFRFALNKICGQHKSGGYINMFPYRILPEQSLLQAAVKAVIDEANSLRAFDETQALFVVPFGWGLLPLRTSAAALSLRLNAYTKQMARLEEQCEKSARSIYQASELDSKQLDEFALLEQPPVELPIDDVSDSTQTTWFVTHSIISFAVGTLFGRWNIRQSMESTKQIEDRGPFTSLPSVPPATLLKGNRVDGYITPHSYPIEVRQDGILTDDSDNPDDILERVRLVFETIWKDEALKLEAESCQILSVPELRDYFRKPGKGGFWDDHISRYSKNRRKAPIYWLLQSSKKNYSLWLYYHRLDKDLLFKVLVNYVEPKIRLENSHAEGLRNKKAASGDSGKEAKRLAGELESKEELISELKDFEDKLRRAANLHLVPDLNDGVVLNIAPLWELVPWKEAKNYWDELLEGKYEWSSLGKQLRQKGLVK
jgi:hypothetical protein